jgi:glycosyltransferase involved in cell wall biosynthesis
VARTPRLLTVVGDANDISTWSGIPYFFLRAAKRQGLLDGGVSLHPKALAHRRAAWNLRSLLLTGKARGYQYSEGFLSRLFAQAHLSEAEPLNFITHFPLLPPRPWSRKWTVTPYIDATLKQNFEDYGFGQRIARAHREDTLARERDAYHAAERVVCFARWAADVVTDFYGVPASRCHVIFPGANLIEEQIEEPSLEQAPTTGGGALRLGFIGKDWERKGLPLLLEIATELTRRGVPTEVVTIGPDAKVLPRHPCLRPQGFIDKHHEMERFVALVRSFHFGCLLSSVEAFGISTFECLRLGVPVVGTRAGGIVDSIPDGLGFLFDPKSGLDEIVSILESHAQNPDQYTALRSRVISRVSEFSWNRTVSQFLELFPSDRSEPGDVAKPA